MVYCYIMGILGHGMVVHNPMISWIARSWWPIVNLPVYLHERYGFKCSVTVPTRTPDKYIHTYIYLLRFYRKWFIKELFVIMLLDVVYKNDCHTLIIILRAASPAHHLQDISNRVVHIALGLAIKIFSPFHYHKVSRKIHSPSQGAGSNKNLVSELQDGQGLQSKALRVGILTPTPK